LKTKYKLMSRIAFPILVLALLFTLTVSGCTRQVQTGYGVVIEEFTPAFAEVYPEEPIIFLLKVKNIGSVEAMDVHAELLGLDEDWAASSKGVGQGPITPGGEKLPEESWCRFTETEKHRTLKPPDLFYGTEGEVATCTWKYKAPDIPSGFKPTYDITARVFYTYSTDVVKSFTLASAGELYKLKEQGKSLPSSTVSSTKSPVSITAESDDPIRVWSDKGSVSLPLKITISNTGGGMVCSVGKCKKTGEDGHEWNKLNLYFKPLGGGIVLGSECRGNGDGGGGKVVEVWPNRDNTIICEIEFTEISNIVGHEERLLQISAVYSYFADAESSVTIL
jgi:hypothetical protein